MVIYKTSKTEKITPGLTTYQRYVILILSITQFSVILDFLLMSPIGDIMMKSLILKPSQFGVAVSVYAFSAGISGILTAGFADYFDRKKLLLFFYSGFILGTLFCGVANSYLLLVGARIVTGLFGGVIGSISMVVITDLFDTHYRGRAMGFVRMGFGASQVLGVPISLYIAGIWGWHVPFLAVAMLAILTAILIAIKLKPIVSHMSDHQQKRATNHLWSTLINPIYVVGFAATAIQSIGGFMLMPFSSAFAINNLKITTSQLPILFMVSGVGSLVILPLVGVLSDKVNRFRLFAVATIWMMATILIYTNLSVTPFWAVIILNILMTMGITSRAIPASALISVLPAVKDRGAFMSINASFQLIAGGFATTASGFIVIQKSKYMPLEGYPFLGYVIGFVSICGAYLVFMISEKVKKSEGISCITPN